MTDVKQSIFDIAEISRSMGVRNAIVSPGSRSAPLTLAFVRHPGITCRAVVDERSAAFVALGIARQTQSPVAVICTSGTAALNLASAVAEAFFQQIPLLVLTADRPPEWIAQNDGQTVFQRNLYGDNCRGYFELPVDYDHPDAKWQIRRTLSDAINCATDSVPGPVHVNVPLREPLYPGTPFTYSQGIRTITAASSERRLPDSEWDQLLDIWNSCDQKLIVAGLQAPDAGLNRRIEACLGKADVVLLGDVVSNCKQDPEIYHYDAILHSGSEALLKSLKPDLLLTFGGPVVSKSLKQFLRKYTPEYHWHLQFESKSIDPFQSLTTILPVSPDYFFESLATELMAPFPVRKYRGKWLRAQRFASDLVRAFLDQAEMSEILAMAEVLDVIQPESVLHLGNSAIVRLASFVGQRQAEGLTVYSNRGTNGIDGTLSSAVGAALSTSRLTTVILGDLSFFYDRNALWQAELPPNLRIIVFNNHGGGIFRVLDGSKEMPELESFFEVSHSLSAKNTALDHGVKYSTCDSIEALREELPGFFDTGKGPGLLEVQFDRAGNAETFLNFKALLREIS